MEKITCKNCWYCLPYGRADQKKKFLCTAHHYQHFIKNLNANRKNCKLFKEKTLDK
jgi:hypothetical protein